MRKCDKDIFYLVDIACFHGHGMAIKLIGLLDDISGVEEEKVEKEKRFRDGCNGSIGKIEEMGRQKTHEGKESTKERGWRAHIQGNIKQKEQNRRNRQEGEVDVACHKEKQNLTNSYYSYRYYHSIHHFSHSKCF